MTLGLLILSERRDTSFRDGLLPPTDSGRFVLFSLPYFWLRGGLAGSDGGTHLNAFLEYHRCHGDEGTFVQRSLTRVKSRQTSVNRPRLEETEPHEWNTHQNTHLSCLPGYPQLVVRVFSSLIPSRVSARLTRRQRSASPPPRSRALALSPI